jgi:hypothetical protein
MDYGLAGLMIECLKNELFNHFFQLVTYLIFFNITTVITICIISNRKDKSIPFRSKLNVKVKVKSGDFCN